MSFTELLFTKTLNIELARSTHLAIKRHRFVPFAGFLLVACGASQGTRPEEMSASQHEATAGQEQTAAAQHMEQYQPKAEETGPLTCAVGDASGPYAAGGICWTSRSNPTEQHRKDAEEHRSLAEKHRAAASALRDTEARDCSGIAEQDRDTSPFYHREDVAEVTVLERTRNRNQAPGARIVFRAVPGLTTEWLQRLVDCHRARAAAAGYDMPEMGYCPLALKGVNAVVSSTHGGFAVEVTSNDFATAQEVQRRANLLQSGTKP